MALSGGADAALVERRAGDPDSRDNRDRGVWHVPLDGSPPHRVIPAQEGRDNGWLGYLRFKPRPADVGSDALLRCLSVRSSLLVQ